MYIVNIYKTKGIYGIRNIINNKIYEQIKLFLNTHT